MDYLSVQQRKDALDDTIHRAVLRFEVEAETRVSEIKVIHRDGRCVSISTRLNIWH